MGQEWKMVSSLFEEVGLLRKHGKNIVDNIDKLQCLQHDVENDRIMNYGYKRGNKEKRCTIYAEETPYSLRQLHRNVVLTFMPV